MLEPGDRHVARRRPVRFPGQSLQDPGQPHRHVPLAGTRAARELELGARDAARTYIRAAREAGHTWHQIGRALALVPGGDFDQAGDAVCEAAYTYAAGSPSTATAIRYGRSFGWACRTCDQAISDRGLCDSPADDERGHAPDCARLAATIKAWQADWQAEP
jgi:hypothetical protein